MQQRWQWKIKIFEALLRSSFIRVQPLRKLMVITVGHIWTAAVKTVTNLWTLTWKKSLICIWFELLMWQIIRWQTVIKIQLSLNPSTRFANSDEGSQRGMLPLKILGLLTTFVLVVSQPVCPVVAPTLTGAPESVYVPVADLQVGWPQKTF